MPLGPGPGYHGAMAQALPEVLVELPEGAELGESGERLEALSRRLGYSFERPALLRVALTVGSWANENRDAGWPSNACLEFFGDAVLDLVVSYALWRRFPTLAEGALTRLRASVVRTESLAEAARALDLGGDLWVGKGDEAEARERVGTLADAFEAVVGAVYLDARAADRDPISAIEAVFALTLGDKVMSMAPEDGQDPKSRLQQLAQARFRRTPVYEALGEPPPPQDPHWRVRVLLPAEDGSDERELGRGEGRSLRAAERAAARKALGLLESETTED